MMMYVKDSFFAEIEVKKSKFLAYLFPYALFNDKLNKLKKAHPKARHFVYAYRFLNDYDQIVQNCSDDGEPRGTSGPPILKVLQAKNIINSAIIVVRYFGGIKLGAGGLVRAYSNATNQVINQATFYSLEKLSKKTLIIPYSNLSKIEYHLKKLDITILSKTFQEQVILEVEGKEENLNKFINFNLN